MTVAFIQSASNYTTGTSVTTTLSSGTTTGRVIVAAIGESPSGIPTGTPSGGGATWVASGSWAGYVVGYGYVYTYWYEGYGVTNGTTAFSMSFTAGASTYGNTMTVMEFSGLASSSSSAIDKNGGTFATSTTVTSSTLSPTATGDLWISLAAFYYHNTSGSLTGPTGGWSSVSISAPHASAQFGLAYYVSPDSSNHTTSWTTAGTSGLTSGSTLTLFAGVPTTSGTGSITTSFSASGSGTIAAANGGFLLSTFDANASGVLGLNATGSLSASFFASASGVFPISATGSLTGSFSASAYRATSQLASLPTLSVQVAFNPSNVQSLSQSWTDVTPYVRDFTTKLGRQHFLDRVEAGTLNMTVNERTGFFLNGSVNGTGYVIQPRLPIKVTATWTPSGGSPTTYPVFYGLIDSIDEKITDQLNVDLTINATDLVKFLSLRYMNSTNFWSNYANVSSTINWYRCTSANNAIVTGASWTGGSYVTYTAVNNFSSGDNVTITGLGTGTGSDLNLNNYTIVSATSSSFTVNNPGGLTNPSVSSGNGTAYNTILIDQNSGYAGSYYDQLVAFPPNGAMVYTNDGCVDLTNGSNVSSGNIIFGTAGSPYGIDFWVLGQGISGATNLLTVLYRNSSGIATTLYLGATTTGLLRAGKATTGATTWTTISSNPISDGYWHHIGCYISGTTLYIYVDGTTTSFDTTQSGVAFTASNTISGACYVDEIIVSNSSISFNNLQNRYKAGTLLTQGFPVTSNNVLSGDRIAEILCIAGFGTVSGGQVVLNSNTYFINDSATAWVNGASGNGFIAVEPWYWDSPVTGSTALDLILQICDTDIGSFYQETNGTFSYYNQLYYGTWNWALNATSGTWSPNSYTPTGDHVWTDDTSSTYH